MHSSAVRPEWTDLSVQKIEAGLKRKVAPLPSAVPSAAKESQGTRVTVGTGSRPVYRWQTSGGWFEKRVLGCTEKNEAGGKNVQREGEPACQYAWCRIKRAVLQPGQPVGSSHRESEMGGGRKGKGSVWETAAE